MKKKYFLSSLFAATLLASPLSADVISMKTNVAVGEKMTLALNNQVKATLTWGNGDSQEIVFNGHEIEVEVKHADLTLKADQPITSLYCAKCGLKELNLQAAPALVSVVCPDNQLTALNVEKNVHLVDLNCENNALTALSVDPCTAMENLNVAYNKLQKLSVAALPQMKTLICSHNQLTTLQLSTSANLETLWCQGNKIETINLATDSRLYQLCAFDNQLKQIPVEALHEVADLWVDKNQLSELDLSNTSIQVLSASDNQLTSIKFNTEWDARNSLRGFYVDGNKLFYNSFPSFFDMGAKIAYNVDNQSPFTLVDKVNVKEEYSMKSLLGKNAWNEDYRPEVAWKTVDGKQLVVGEDYAITSTYGYTFLKPASGKIYAEVSSPRYPRSVIKSTSIDLIVPAGIDAASADNLDITVDAGHLYVTAAVPTDVQVYNMAGMQLIHQSISAGLHSWNLPAGIYLVNGQKVQVK